MCLKGSNPKTIRNMNKVQLLTLIESEIVLNSRQTVPKTIDDSLNDSSLVNVSIENTKCEDKPLDTTNKDQTTCKSSPQLKNNTNIEVDDQILTNSS